MTVIRTAPATRPRPDVDFLYHGSPRPIERDRLTPQFNMSVGGHEGRFVFATDHLDLARCYALKTDDMLGAGLLADERTAYCVINHDAAAALRSLTGTVYKFPADGFRRVMLGCNPTNEFVSRETIRLRHAERIAVHGINDLKDRGIAVLLTPPGMAEREFLVKLRAALYSTETLLRQGYLIPAP